MKKIWRLLPLLLCVCILSSCFGDGGGGSTTDAGVINKAANFGIGYGYDVLNSPYFESGQVKKRNSILNLSEAKKLIERTQQSSSTSGSVYGKTVEEYAKNYQNRVGMSMDTSTEFAVYSVSVGLSFDVSGSGFFEQKISKNEQQMFYTYFDDINTYYLEMKNYNLDTLRGMLSDFFIKDVSRESSETKGMTDEELAKYLMATYGTHLITGVQMGGRLEFSYVISTSNSEVYEQLQTSLDIKFKGGVGSFFNIGVEGSEEEKVEQLLSNENVRSEASIRRFGGMSTGLWTYEELQANYKEWANSLNEDKYQNAVGIAPDGMVALWNLIPEGNDGLVETMRTVYRQNGLDAYNTNLEGLRPTVQGPVEEIDLTRYYDMSSGAATITLGEHFKHPNYDPATGVFMANGRIHGCDIERYVFKGMLGLQDEDGVVVNQLIDSFSICVQSEHDIEIVLENVAYTSPANQSAVYVSDKVENKNIIVILTSSGESSNLSSGEQNVIKGGSDKPAVDIPNLIVTGAENLVIRGGNGANGTDTRDTGYSCDSAAPGKIGQEAIHATNLTISGTGIFEFWGGDGGNGGNGGNIISSTLYFDGREGGDGGYAICADNVTIERGEAFENSLQFYGGNGGNGGNGKQGKTGSAGNSPSEGHGGVGGNGQRGGHGGDGGIGATAIYCKKIMGAGSIICVSGNGGAGGAGGKGGTGGKGGDGGHEQLYVAIQPEYTWNGGNGGDGGIGGNGGYGGQTAPVVDGPDKMIVIDNTVIIAKESGVNGKGGAGGKGGDPGKGGNRGMRESLFKEWYGSDGGPGDYGKPGQSR